MAEAKSIFSLESAPRLRIDIDNKPYPIRSMREFRLKEQVEFRRECQSISDSWGKLFGEDAAPTDAEIDYVTKCIDDVIVRIAEDPTPFLALTETQKLEVIGAFAGNARGASAAPSTSSSPASPVSTESTQSA